MLTQLLLKLLFCIIFGISDINGTGFPNSNNITWTLTKEGTHPSTVKYGDKLKFTVETHWPAKTSNLNVSIFATDSDLGLFHICFPQIEIVGNNFVSTVNKTELNNQWKFVNNKNKVNVIDKSILDFGTIINTGTDTVNATNNKIKFTFSVIVQNFAGNSSRPYYINVGADYDNAKSMYIGQAGYNWTNISAEIADWGNGSFELTGPTELNVGETGIYTVKVVINSMLSSVIVNAFAPLNTTDIMSICYIGVSDYGVGESYACQGQGSSPAFVANSTSNGETFNAIASLNLGDIVNSKRRYGSSSTSDDTLVIKVAAQMRNATTIGNTHKLGVVVQQNAGFIWAGIQNITVASTNVSTPDNTLRFKVYSTIKQIRVGTYAPLFVNISFPLSSSAKYVLDVLLPVNNSYTNMTFLRHAVLHIGSNIKCFSTANITVSQYPANNTWPTKVSLNLGTVTNLGVSDNAFDGDMVLQIVFSVPNVTTVVNGTVETIVVGLQSGNAIWINSENATILTSPPTYAKLPEISFSSTQSSNVIYNGSVQALWLDIVIPVGTQYDFNHIDFVLSKNNGRAILSACEIKILEIGEHLIASNKSSFPVQLISTFDDKYVDQANLDFSTTFTNLGRFSYPWEKNKERIRVQVLLHITPHILVNVTTPFNSTYWIMAGVRFFSYSYLFVGFQNFTYDPTTVYNNISSAHTPTIIKHVVDNNTQIQIGQAYAIKIKMTTVPQSIGHYTFNGLSFNNSLHVCRVAQVNRGVNFPCIPSDVTPTLTPLNGSGSATQTSKVVYDLLNLVNTGKTTDYTNADNNTGEFDVVVQLREGFGAIDYTKPYVAVSSINIGDSLIWIDGATLNAIPSNLNVSLTAVYELSLRNKSTTVVSNGGASAVLDVYLPSGNFGNYTVFFITTRPSIAPKIIMCSVKMMYAGINIPCISDPVLTRSITNFTINNTVHEFYQIDVGYMTNVGFQETTKNDRNKVTFEMDFITVSNTTNINENLEITAHVNTSGSSLWFGTVNFTVTNVLPSVANLNPIFALVPLENQVKIEIFEEKTFKINMTFPESVTNITITVYSNTSEQEGRFTFRELNLTSYGNNFCCLDKPGIVTYTNASTYGTTQVDRIMAQFVLTNTGTYKRYQWADYHKDSDVLQFEVKARLTDHAANLNGTKQYIYFEINYSGEVKTLASEVTVSAAMANKPDLQMFLDVQQQNVTKWVPGNTIELSVTLNHTNISRANAYDVNVAWYLSYLLEYLNVKQWICFNPNVTNKGLEGIVLQFNKLMYSDNVTVKINVTIDPNRLIPKDSGTKYLTVPLDARYLHREKEKGNFAANISAFTSTYKTGFEVFVDDCWGALGMENGVITDCQIRASDFNSSVTAVNARFNSASGWTTDHAGSGLYGQEYLEISMGNKTKLNAVTLQPNALDAMTAVMNFTLQYSEEGLIWYDVKVNGTNQTQIYQASYGPNNTAKVNMNTNVIGRYFRFLPLSGIQSTYKRSVRIELIGCALTSDRSPADACMPPTYNKSIEYSERGYLLNPDTGALYVCMITKVSAKSVCSKTKNFGKTWEIIEPTVGYIHYYNKKNKELFGTASNTKTRVLSNDDGFSWFEIDENTYVSEKITAPPAVVFAVKVPLTDLSGVASSLYGTYGLSYNSTHKISVDMRGIYLSVDNAVNWNLMSYWFT